jgi:hypothetical protein
MSKSFNIFESEFLPFSIKVIPVFLSSILWIYIYSKNKGLIVYPKYIVSKNSFKSIFQHKFFFDFLQNIIAISFFKLSYKYIYLCLDKGLIEILGPKGFFYQISQRSLKNSSFLNSGLLFHYFWNYLVIILSLICLVFVYYYIKF